MYTICNPLYVRIVLHESTETLNFNNHGFDASAVLPVYTSKFDIKKYVPINSKIKSIFWRKFWAGAGDG